MLGATEVKELVGAVLLLAFCFNLGAVWSSLVVFNYIHSLVTSLQKEESSLMAMAMMCRKPMLGFDRILLLNESVLAEMGERKYG